jgi:S-adenosylmethionine hydrolase
MATVTWIDRFGNTQLDLTPEALSSIGLAHGATARIAVDPDGGGPVRTGRWVGAYGELGRGELGLLEDANGQVALVLDRDSAALALGVGGPGAVVRIVGGSEAAPS